MWSAETCGVVARMTYRIARKANTMRKREGLENLARLYENRRRDMQDLTLAVSERSWKETLYNNKKTRRRGNSDGRKSK